MSPTPFKRIGLLGKPRNELAAESLLLLYHFLQKQQCEVLVQKTLGQNLPLPKSCLREKEQLANDTDLLIVVGGDGSMLRAARDLVDAQVPMVGINRGHLGFLTDVQPTQMQDKVGEILNGEYVSEERFLLQGRVTRGDKLLVESTALNEVVLHPGAIARMLEFEVHIDGRFVYSQRSDGLIVATPTGSTAYSLSGGGPILSPALNAINLVPMFPHTLSSRPIVINADSKIDIIVSDKLEHAPQIGWDGQVHVALKPGDAIRIEKYQYALKLLHPTDYDYFTVLRTKLGWGQKLGQQED